MNSSSPKPSTLDPRPSTSAWTLDARLTKTFQGKKVFVTGHTGFKGSWLCEWLLSLGAEVHGFSLPEPVSDPSLFDQLHLSDRIHDVRGDIRDAAAVKRAILQADPDFVFHLAAQPLVRLSYREPVETWHANVMGTIHVLEGLRQLTKPCVAIFVTTDKVYENREWLHGYRETDPLGGYDPYSSSKAAAELAIQSWRQSYFRHDDEKLNGGKVDPDLSPSTPQPINPSTEAHRRQLFVASARAGNVIGGGDWAEDRIVPDCIRSLQQGQAIPVRNKVSTRPWQHVLEPLSGYLLLAARLSSPTLDPRPPTLDSSFNFGPHLESNRTVAELVNEVLKHWPGEWVDQSDPHAPHEAEKLSLATDKAFHTLGWQPRWDFPATIEKTVGWYQAVDQGADPAALTRKQIEEYSTL